MADDRSKFSFQPLPGKKFNSIEGKEAQELLLKWSLKDRIKAQTFTFDQPFQAYQRESFVLDFFQDGTVVSSLQVLSSSGKWGSLGTAATTVVVEPVPCSQLSMTFFDRLQQQGIVRESGHIAKCFDEFYGDFTISDELRKCLLLEDGDNYDLFSESDREEFLFRLFKHICLGGAVCQFEDDIKPYMDTTKALYKDLVSVTKDGSSGELHIASCVFRITASDDCGVYYPAGEQHEQNFAYLVVDPFKRHATVLYHKFGASRFD